MRSSWAWAAPFGLALLGAMVVLGFTLAARAQREVEAALDRRLVTVARSAARMAALQLARGEDPSALLRELRDDGDLETLFVSDAASHSLADARDSVTRTTRYTLFDVDPDRLQQAADGRESLSSAYDLVEGSALRSVYVPVGSAGVLVAQVSPAFIEPLRALERLPWIALALGVLAAGAFTLALLRGHRRLEQGAQAAIHVERLALAGRLAAQVAHEIKNPLAILRGAAQLATDAASQGRNPSPFLDDLVEEVDRIDSLVEDFLSLSRDVALRLEPHDLAQVADRAASLAELAMKRRIVRELAPQPPVEADERRVRQMLLGLILNAFESDPQATVTVRSGRDRDTAWVEVADDGPGMDAATLARAGEPFFTTKTQGTGLGLAVARQIAAAHGGTLTMSSQPGHGTQVRVSLPAPPANAPTAPARTPSEPSGTVRNQKASGG